MHEQLSRGARVVVRGHLGEHLATCFDGFELAFQAGENSLTDSFHDQGQLDGLLRLRVAGVGCPQAASRKSDSLGRRLSPSCCAPGVHAARGAARQIGGGDR